MGEQSATGRTVLIAGAANIFVGLIKLAAGILVGSSAMLAEAAHSAADTLNQGFLLASLRKGARPADAKHPFGYGQERYFWSLLAAFGIFIAGGGFSIFEGLLALGHEEQRQPAACLPRPRGGGPGRGDVPGPGAEAVCAARPAAATPNCSTTCASSPDTTVKAALFEDSAAMVGLVLAGLGLVLRQVTGSPVWDGAASIAIGVLLIVVAVRLGMDNREFLIGRAADPRELRAIQEEIEKTPGVDELVELLTMYLGPEHLIVAARVAFSDDISADRAEDVGRRHRQTARRPAADGPACVPGPHPDGLGRADSRAAVSSIPACTKACGRLPAKLALVHVVLLGVQARRSAGSAVALEPVRRLRVLPARLRDLRHPEPAEQERALGLVQRPGVVPEPVHVPVFGQFLADRADRRAGARVVGWQGAADHRQQQRGIDPRVGGRALPAARRVDAVARGSPGSCRPARSTRRPAGARARPAALRPRRPASAARTRR